MIKVMKSSEYFDSESLKHSLKEKAIRGGGTMLNAYSEPSYPIAKHGDSRASFDPRRFRSRHDSYCI